MDENFRVSLRSSLERNTQFREASSAEYSSIYAWLLRFSRYFELEPDKIRISLPFSDKQQVYTLYMLDVKADNGEGSTYPSFLYA